MKVGGISPNNSPYIMGPLILPTFIPPFGASEFYGVGSSVLGVQSRGSPFDTWHVST